MEPLSGSDCITYLEAVKLRSALLRGDRAGMLPSPPSPPSVLMNCDIPALLLMLFCCRWMLLLSNSGFWKIIIYQG